MRIIQLPILLCLLLAQPFNAAQLDAAARKAERRNFAVSIIMSLADEARSFKDPALGARVLARAADALWDIDADTARTLFRRAWEAAEKADTPEENTPSNNSAPAMIIAIPGKNGDSRSEVLNIAARRDRSLGEEFLAKLIDAQENAAKQTTDHVTRSVNDSWTTSDDTSKRLNLGLQLLDENEPEKAFQFAAPALDRVNVKTITFLSKLRLVKPDLADKQFMLLLARAEIDPTTDANTVSVLSSYVFTPGLYMTFLSDGGVRWIPALEPMRAPDIPIDIRDRFFRTASNILLRPSPPADQDLTSAGVIGKYMVIKRLLPLFEQHAPNVAIALRSQLVALAERSNGTVDDDDFLLSQGLTREPDSRTVLDRLQERADRAKDQRARDAIYADAAAVLAIRGNPLAQDFADKIDNAYYRKVARRYVDISLVRWALSKKDAASALRFAQADSLTHAERTWSYLKIAPLLMNSDRTRGVELLEQALIEARRIESDDSNRALLIMGVAIKFLSIDRVRCWEVASEGIKAANETEGFSGDAATLRLGLLTSSGLKVIDLDTSDVNLTKLWISLAKQDLARANDLAKSLSYEAPRAVAILAVASAAIGQTKSTTAPVHP